MTVNGGKDLTGDIYIARREFLGNITASVVNPFNAPGTATSIQSGYNVKTYNLNAGIGTSFPWLSQVARNFTFYEFEGLIYEYKPLSGESGNLNTNALGKVVMATQYDPDAPSFTSAIQMENYDYATACKPAEHMLHGVETKSRQRSTNMLYIRTGPTSKDEILTDLGDFQVATEGVPMMIPAGTVLSTVVTSVIGELWVAYKVRLSRANIFTGAGTSLPGDAHLFNKVAAANPLVSGTSAAVAAVGGLLARSYNTTVGTLIGCPKLTNTIGTTLVSIDNSNMAVCWQPGTNGNFIVAVYGQDVNAELLRYDTVAQGNQSQLNTAITNGLDISSVQGGTVTPATLTFTQGGAGLNTPPWTSTGNGISSWTASATTVGGMLYMHLTIQASSSQVPILIIRTNPTPSAGGIQGTVEIHPCAISITN